MQVAVSIRVIIRDRYGGRGRVRAEKLAASLDARQPATCIADRFVSGRMSFPLTRSTCKGRVKASRHTCRGGSQGRKRLTRSTCRGG